MVLYPEAQRKAQEEIDAVLGTERLPDFGDEASLPYVSALCTEVQRWHPVAPLGEFDRPSLIWGLTSILLFRNSPPTYF
jgi:cytochrome P450